MKKLVVLIAALTFAGVTMAQEPVKKAEVKKETTHKCCEDKKAGNLKKTSADKKADVKAHKCDGNHKHDANHKCTGTCDHHKKADAKAVKAHKCDGNHKHDANHKCTGTCDHHKKAEVKK